MNKLLSFKNLIVVLLSVVVLFAFTACEKQRQDNLSDRMYEYGVAAYEIIEDYFSSKLTAAEAEDKLKDNKALQETYYYAAKYEDNSSEDLYVKMATSDAYYAMAYKSIGSGTDADIREAQDKLEKALWK